MRTKLAVIGVEKRIESGAVATVEKTFSMGPLNHKLDRKEKMTEGVKNSGKNEGLRKNDERGEKQWKKRKRRTEKKKIRKEDERTDVPMDGLTHDKSN